MADPVLDLLWSLWTELGVPGVLRRHRHVAVDPEPLVVMTPRLAEGDPRLLQLAFDWCLAHGARLRAQRLKALAGQCQAETRARFAAFATDLERAGAPRWAPRQGSLGLERDRDVVALPVDRPSLVRFRLRTVCGVSTRAEVLAQLLQMQDRPCSARELTPPGVSRGSADRVLLDLREAGIVRADGAGRGKRHQLASRASWQDILRTGDLAWWDWWAAFQLVETWEGLRAREGSAVVLRVEAVGDRSRLAECARRLGLEEPPAVEGVAEAHERLVRWGARVLEGIASPDRDPAAPRGPE